MAARARRGRAPRAGLRGEEWGRDGHGRPCRPWIGSARFAHPVLGFALRARLWRSKMRSRAFCRDDRGCLSCALAAGELAVHSQAFSTDVRLMRVPSFESKPSALRHLEVGDGG